MSPRAILQRRSSVHGGFILAETLAVFTISAFVLLGLVSVSSVLLQAVDRSMALVQATDDLDRSMNALARDISGLARARWAGIEPQPFVFEGGPNSLFFALRERDPNGLGATRVVALREIVGGRGPRLVRSEADLSASTRSFSGLNYGSPRDVATGAARLRFFYVMPVRPGQPEPTSLKSWPSGPTLPSAVIAEAVDAVSSRVIVSMRINIHANADIGCIKGETSNDRSADPVEKPAGTATAQGAPDPDLSPNLAALPSAASKDDGKAEAFCGRANLDDQGGPVTDSGAPR